MLYAHIYHVYILSGDIYGETMHARVSRESTRPAIIARASMVSLCALPMRLKMPDKGIGETEMDLQSALRKVANLCGEVGYAVAKPNFEVYPFTFCTTWKTQKSTHECSENCDPYPASRKTGIACISRVHGKLRTAEFLPGCIEHKF